MVANPQPDRWHAAQLQDGGGIAQSSDEEGPGGARGARARRTGRCWYDLVQIGTFIGEINVCIYIYM